MEKRKKTIAFFILFAILIFIIFLLDEQIFSLIQNLRNPTLDTFFSWILFAEQGIIYYPFTVLSTFGIILWKRRKDTYPFIATFLISLLAILFLKTIIFRARPLFSGTSDSFPAGHSLIFAPLPFLEYKKNNILKIIWSLLSGLIVFTRVWFGVHYLSDILASILIIYIFSYIFKNNWKKLKTLKHKKIRDKNIKEVKWH